MAYCDECGNFDEFLSFENKINVMKTVATSQPMQSDALIFALAEDLPLL